MQLIQKVVLAASCVGFSGALDARDLQPYTFPTAADWPVIGGWPGPYQELAPAPVIDLCGGNLGQTTWHEVSAPCAAWVVKMLKCSQHCAQMHRFTGFGVCMDTCSGPPDNGWCQACPSCSDEVNNYCNTFIRRWRDTCQVSGTQHESYDEWTASIDTCAYTCDGALELEMSMGQAIGWRSRKCNPEAFQCGDVLQSDGQYECLRVADNHQCKPPVGLGLKECSWDDPGCGAGCFPPAPAPAPAPALSAEEMDAKEEAEQTAKEAAEEAAAEKRRKRNAAIAHLRAAKAAKAAQRAELSRQATLDAARSDYIVYEDQLAVEAEAQTPEMTHEQYRAAVAGVNAEAEEAARTAAARNEAGHEVAPVLLRRKSAVTGGKLHA